MDFNWWCYKYWIQVPDGKAIKYCRQVNCPHLKRIPNSWKISSFKKEVKNGKRDSVKDGYGKSLSKM